MVIQRIVGLALGYEDLNDYDESRDDSALDMIAKVSDIKGEHRRRSTIHCKGLVSFKHSSKTLIVPFSTSIDINNNLNQPVIFLS